MSTGRSCYLTTHARDGIGNAIIAFAPIILALGFCARGGNRYSAVALLVQHPRDSTDFPRGVGKIVAVPPKKRAGGQKWLDQPSVTSRI